MAQKTYDILSILVYFLLYSLRSIKPSYNLERIFSHFYLAYNLKIYLYTSYISISNRHARSFFEEKKAGEAPAIQSYRNTSIRRSTLMKEVKLKSNLSRKHKYWVFVPNINGSWDACPPSVPEGIKMMAIHHLTNLWPNLERIISCMYIPVPDTCWDLRARC